MRDWFLDLNSGKVRPSPQLFDSSKKRFDDPNDLVALRVPADQDRLSEFILNHFGPLFKVCPHMFSTPRFALRNGFQGRRIRRPLSLHSRKLSRPLRCNTQLPSLRTPPLRLDHLSIFRAQSICFAWNVGRMDCAVRSMRRMAYKCKAGPGLCGNRGLCRCAGRVCEWYFGGYCACSTLHNKWNMDMHPDLNVLYKRVETEHLFEFWKAPPSRLTKIVYFADSDFEVRSTDPDQAHSQLWQLNFECSRSRSSSRRREG